MHDTIGGAATAKPAGSWLWNGCKRAASHDDDDDDDDALVAGAGEALGLQFMLVNWRCRHRRWWWQYCFSADTAIRHRLPVVLANPAHCIVPVRTSGTGSATAAERRS